MHLPNPSAVAGCDTRSDGLNSEFSFKTGCLTKTKELSALLFSHN